MATLLYLAALARLALCAPQVQVGNTTLIGRDVTLLQQDFFGGERLSWLSFVSLTLDRNQVFPLLSLRWASFA